MPTFSERKWGKAEKYEIMEGGTGNDKINKIWTNTNVQ